MDLEADVQDIETLQWLANHCARILEALLLEENAQAEEITAREGHWVSRQCAEFNLWCVKVGVNGQGLRSLDVRLKDVPETCDLMKDLLKSLRIDLKKIQQPTDSIQHLMKVDVEANNSDSASDGSSLSFDSLSSLESTESGKDDAKVTAEHREAQLLKKHIEDTIDRLHGHALQIDKAGAKHRQQRVKVYIEKDGPKFAYQGYREIAYRKAKVQFPLASDVLYHRMAESFARRRIRFDYLRHHQKKRSVERPKERTKPTPSQQFLKSVSRGDISRARLAGGIETPQTLNQAVEQHSNDQQTIYSTTERTKLETPVERQQEKAESVASIALRHPGFPPPPRITSHSFQCPYCRLDFRAAEGEKARWSQHVMQDFEPYFCPVEQCTKPFDLSNNFDGLLYHLQDHVEERFHVDLPEGEHQELGEEEFERYIAQQGHISDENLAVMKKAARRKGAFIFDNCPFCGGYPDVLENRFPVSSAPEAQAELRRHIRQHMQDIALFLPPYREEIFDDDKDLQSSVFSHERGGDSSLENSGDFQTLCDRDSCDCKEEVRFLTEFTSDPGIPDSESTSELVAADVWEESFPGLPGFDRSGLDKEYCIQDDVLYHFLTNQLRSAPEISPEVLDATSVHVQEIPETVPRRSRREKRSTVLEIFKLDDYKIRQREYSNTRFPGTYDWLLDTDAFQTWLSKPGLTFSCYGFPGSGKTILASAVVDHVVNYFAHDETTGVAFVYCDQSKLLPGAGDDARYLLANILKQLAEHIPSISPSVELLYNPEGVFNVLSSTTEVCHRLGCVAEGYSRVFIIVDAIDEIEADSGGRREFLSEMIKLQEKCGLNLFLTSRPIVDIDQKFLFTKPHPTEDITKGFLPVASRKMNVPQYLGGSIHMDFCASAEDIRRYVDYRMANLPSQIRPRPELQKELENWIVDQVDGMFLLAQAYLDGLEEQVDDDWTEDSMWKSCLHAIDPAIICHHRGFFAKMSDCIRYQRGNRPTLAEKAMQLVLSSRQQLKATELEHALSFTDLLGGDWPDIKDILLACAGLLAIDGGSNTIVFSHHIVKEFVPRYLSNLEHTGDDYLTDLCINCLSSEAFHAGPCSTDSEFRQRLQSYPFYSYAASNWGYHARAALRYNKKLSFKVLAFLSRESTAQAAGQALKMVQLPSQHSHHIQEVPSNISGLHLATYFNLEGAAESLLRNGNSEPRDSHHRTPLMYAVEQGISLSKLFISYGADVNAGDIRGRTPLHLAAMHFRHDSIDWLVRSGADVNAIDNWRMSPLHMAAEDTDFSTVFRLLESGARVDNRDYMGWTPLLRATMAGCNPIVKLLLRDGASVDDVDSDSVSALSIAAMMGHGSIVKTLLQHGANLEKRDKQGWTPLLHATASGKEPIVLILLEWGADVRAKEEDGWDALLIATESGHISIVSNLLSYGANVKSTLTEGYSPLLIAAYRGYETIVNLLCRYSSSEDREAQEQFGQTPLLVAIRHGHETVVDILLGFKVDIEAKEDMLGQTPLITAVDLGHEGVVRKLLDLGADIEATRFDGKNAIHLASVPGRREIYDLLTEHV